MSAGGQTYQFTFVYNDNAALLDLLNISQKNRVAKSVPVFEAPAGRSMACLRSVQPLFTVGQAAAREPKSMETLTRS